MIALKGYTKKNVWYRISDLKLEFFTSKLDISTSITKISTLKLQI